ncbi:MAG TPA: hypothetical protein VNV86_11585 [Candidatus Acidoferrum sp.]|nr:hypothetical protein [Candidatus Acidoferrum sp.]
MDGVDEPALIFNPAGIGFEMGTVNFILNEAGSAPVPDIIAGAGFGTFIVDSNGVPHVDDTNTTPQCQVQHTGTAISFCAVSVSGVIRIMIIGAPNASNIYAAANNWRQYERPPTTRSSSATAARTGGSLAALGITPSWVIRVPTMTASVTVSSVIFGFGSAYGAIQYEEDASPRPNRAR